MTRKEHPLYNTWLDMRKRCRSPNFKQYADYGGRGITVCDRWEDFTLFCEDMGDKPEGCSLDRIDNNGNYTPDNCRWATRSQQSKNRRFFTVPGKHSTSPHISFCAERGTHPKYQTHFHLAKGVVIHSSNYCFDALEEFVDNLIFERDFYNYHNIVLLSD